MFYKWIKYLAAHSILKALDNPTTVTKVGDEHLFAPSYREMNLQVIKENIWAFSINTLRDAAWLLYDNQQIELFGNQRHIFDINLKINDAGLTALKEKEYIWKVIKAVLVGLSFIVGLIVGSRELIKMLP